MLVLLKVFHINEVNNHIVNPNYQPGFIAGDKIDTDQGEHSDAS